MGKEGLSGRSIDPFKPSLSVKNISDAEKWKLLADYDATQAASEFGDKSPQSASKMAQELGAAYLVNVVEQLGSDVASDVLRNLPEDLRQEVLAGLVPERAADLREILSHPAGTVGSLMAKEFLSVPLHFTVKQATQYLQDLPADKKGKISYIYAVDENRRLQGVIQVRDLIFHPSVTLIKDIRTYPVVQVETGMSQRDAAKLLQKHRYLALPVVDPAQKLVGVVNADSALKVFEEQATEDIAKSVGTSGQEIKARSVRQILSLRLPWLSVNILSGLLCAWISGIFSQNLQTAAALFLFVPVVLGLSESTGVQGATIIVRNLVLGSVSLKELKGLLAREVMVGVLIGVICGLVVGGTASFWQGSERLGLALAGSMTLAIFLSALVGLLLPLLFRRLKIDPAMASGPLVLAICDLQTLFVYFTFSGFILSG